MIFNPTRSGGKSNKSEFTVKINVTGADVSVGGTQYSGEQTVKVAKNTIISISISDTSRRVDNLTFNGKVVASPKSTGSKRSLAYSYPVLQDCEVKTWVDELYPPTMSTYHQTITTE